MIKGIGLDVIEKDRIKSLLEQQPRFISRVLTNSEQLEFQQVGTKRKVEWLAGRFAAKEAFAKALGTGIGSQLSFQDITISNAASGQPIIKQPTGIHAHLTITHTREIAAAQVIIEE